MSSWQEICDESAELESWDELVECGDLTKEQAEKVERLGFYGHMVKAAHAKMLENNQPWSREGYTIEARGIEGTSETNFETLDQVREHLKDWIGHSGCWTSSDEMFHNDFCHFSCVGFKLSDLGYDWKEHVA